MCVFVLEGRGRAREKERDSSLQDKSINLCVYIMYKNKNNLKDAYES